MSKFNTPNVRTRNGLPVIEDTGLQATNHKGGTGYTRTPKSELFLAAVSDFGGESTFYETAQDRTRRINKLVKAVAVEDLAWLSEFVLWLRNDANMRTISLVIALEGAKALNDAKISGGRTLVRNAILRADEPGEAVAYWFSNHGRKMPSAVKRGIADGAIKTYNQYSLGKFDSNSKSVRFADVIKLTHPTPLAGQASLFKYAMDLQWNSTAVPDESLTLIHNRKAFLAQSKENQRKVVLSENGSATLKAAGLTWENVASTIGLDKDVWESVIPTLGYMALIRNLRNFQEAGVSKDVLKGVAARLEDPEQVAKSRQLPFRFLAAYRATQGSTLFGNPLEEALNASLANVPALGGKTLVLVDQSGSMFYSNSEKTGMTYSDTARIFGAAIAIRAENAVLVQYGSAARGYGDRYQKNHEVVDFKNSDSVLKTVDKFRDMGGTNTELAVRENFDQSFDRVILLTDEQHNSGRDPLRNIPEKTPVFTFNLAGYRVGGKSTPWRHYFGGLTDQSFAMIQNIENGTNAIWPWEMNK